jgi:hypothetical protein
VQSFLGCWHAWDQVGGVGGGSLLLAGLKVAEAPGQDQKIYLKWFISAWLEDIMLWVLEGKINLVDTDCGG